MHPQKKSVTVWDVPGPLHSLSRDTLMTALPHWSVVMETLPPYSDGDCGIVAIEILLGVSKGHDWRRLDFTDLPQRRENISKLSHNVRTVTTQQYVGGSALPSSQSPPLSSLTPSIPASQPTAQSADIASQTPNTHEPWTNAVAMQDSFYRGHSIIGTLEGGDIRMATLNINGLIDDKLPFLA